jgi:hypothetical protein
MQYKNGYPLIWSLSNHLPQNDLQNTISKSSPPHDILYKSFISSRIAKLKVGNMQAKHPVLS